MKVIHLISGRETGGAKTHVLSLLQNQNKTITAQLLCFRDHFGPAASDVQAYFDFIRALPRDTKRFPLTCFANVYAAGIETADLVRADALLARAAARVAGTAWEENVRLARIPVDFTRALRGAARPSLSRRAVDLARWRAERAAARRPRSAFAVCP